MSNDVIVAEYPADDVILSSLNDPGHQDEENENEEIDFPKPNIVSSR